MRITDDNVPVLGALESEPDWVTNQATPGKIIVGELGEIKAFLIVRRSQVRDYLDVAALSDRYGIDYAAQVLLRIDAYYTDQTKDGSPVSSQLVRQLGAVRPTDESSVTHLGTYKGLDHSWADWSRVTQVCGQVAAWMVERDSD